jgi:hypothetical protein
MTAVFWLLMIYLLAATFVAARAAVRGPRLPGRVAFAIGLFLMAFPWLRSRFSSDGRGDFHPAGAVANLEWWLVMLGLGPVHLICVVVILTGGRKPAPPSHS